MSLARPRAHAAKLPGATRDTKWGADGCYCVGGRMFAVSGVERGSPLNVAFKVDDERFRELTDRDGIVPAPYLARARWVQLTRGDALPLGAANR